MAVSDSGFRACAVGKGLSWGGECSPSSPRAGGEFRFPAQGTGKRWDPILSDTGIGVDLGLAAVIPNFLTKEYQAEQNALYPEVL